MGNLFKKLKEIVSKGTAYYSFYILNKKIDVKVLLKELAISLDNMDVNKLIVEERTITATNVLILKVNHRDSGEKYICKIPLNNESLERLETNYMNLSLLSKMNSAIIPKPIGKIIINEFTNMFVETCIEGRNGYDIFLNDKMKRELLLIESKQILFHIRNNIFNQIKKPIMVPNKVVFLQLQNRFINIMPNNIQFDFSKIFEKVNFNWNLKNIECGLCHGDYWIGNIMFSFDTELRAEAVIDWDRLDESIPVLFDDMHLEVYYLAIKENESVGHQIVKCIKNNKYEIEDALIYWLIFVLKSNENNTEILNHKRWFKRNVIDTLEFLDQLYAG